MAERQPRVQLPVLVTGSAELAQSGTAQCALDARGEDRSERAHRQNLFRGAKA